MGIVDFRLMIVNCGLLMGAEDGGFMFKGENGVIKKQRGKVRSLPVLETILEHLFVFVKASRKYVLHQRYPSSKRLHS